MTANSAEPKDIDEYIASFPKDTQEVLEKVRTTIREAAPDADETIKYDMPTFMFNGKYLVYFAGWKKHLGFYGITSTIIEKFKKELSAYVGVKGSLKFPLDEPIPYDLISKIVKDRVKENMERAEAKGNEKDR